LSKAYREKKLNTIHIMLKGKGIIAGDELGIWVRISEIVVHKRVMELGWISDGISSNFSPALLWDTSFVSSQKVNIKAFSLLCKDPLFLLSVRT
jgi:hypothetical protein